MPQIRISILTEGNMRKLATSVIGPLALLGLWGVATHGQGGQAGGASTQQAPTDRAVYFANSNLQDTWKDLEAKQVINKRVLEVTASISGSSKKETLLWFMPNRLTFG
jgi:hypothetical protein